MKFFYSYIKLYILIFIGILCLQRMYNVALN